jgi:hypothetical protein
MNPQVEVTRSYKPSRLLRWLEGPRLLLATMPTEIIPQGLVTLELKLAGWGWVRLEATGNRERRKWFWNDQDLTLFVPVGSRPILTLGNLWGTQRYQVDATAGRKEVWVPHDNHYQFRLPDSAATNLPSGRLDLPTQRWRAAGINAPGNGHWHVHMPTGRTVTLPAQPDPVSLPALKLESWRTTAPMDELDRRIQRTMSANE